VEILFLLLKRDTNGTVSHRAVVRFCARAALARLVFRPPTQTRVAREVPSQPRTGNHDMICG
jgi:hypothetical protein